MKVYSGSASGRAPHGSVPSVRTAGGNQSQGQQQQSGHIHPDGDGFLLVIRTNESIRRWTSIKRHLSFGLVTQDGDDEGCVRLDRLPTHNEAATIRGVLGIRKRMHHSPEALARMALTAFRPTPENAT